MGNKNNAVLIVHWHEKTLNRHGSSVNSSTSLRPRPPSMWPSCPANHATCKGALLLDTWPNSPTVSRVKQLLCSLPLSKTNKNNFYSMWAHEWTLLWGIFWAIWASFSATGTGSQSKAPQSWTEGIEDGLQGRAGTGGKNGRNPMGRWEEQEEYLRQN